MKAVHFLLAFVVLALATSLASAQDPTPLQDFCIAINDTKTGIYVNGLFCKDPKLATADDFFYKGLNIPKPTPPLGYAETPVMVDQIPGFNTLGLALARGDYAPNGGFYGPHIHPRASEFIIVLKGTLYAGFITSSPNNTVFSKILNPGDVFVFPKGLIHFQVNIGETPAAAIGALNSQNPGVVKTDTAIPDTIYSSICAFAREFQLDVNKVMKGLQTKSWPSS